MSQPQPHPFTVNVDDHEAGLIVRLEGDATVTETDTLRKALQPIVQRQPAHVVLDLAHLLFINSLGLGALLEFRHDLSAHGAKLHLAGASNQIAEILTKTRLAELFPMYPTAEDAIQAG